VLCDSGHCILIPLELVSEFLWHVEDEDHIVQHGGDDSVQDDDYLKGDKTNIFSLIMLSRAWAALLRLRRFSHVILFTQTKATQFFNFIDTHAAVGGPHFASCVRSLNFAFPFQPKGSSGLWTTFWRQLPNTLSQLQHLKLYTFQFRHHDSLALYHLSRIASLFPKSLTTLRMIPIREEHNYMVSICILLQVFLLILLQNDDGECVLNDRNEPSVPWQHPTWPTSLTSFHNLHHFYLATLVNAVWPPSRQRAGKVMQEWTMKLEAQ